MIKLGSVSYPYLAVAQNYNVSYGEVLAFIETIDNKTMPLDSKLNLWQSHALNAWYEEYERRKLIKTGNFS